MASTIATVVFWALPIALVLWVTLLLAASVVRRRRRGVEGVTPGMEVYGSDHQLVGIVDVVGGNGLLVGGQFVPGNVVKRVEARRVILTRTAVAFNRGTDRGDRTAAGRGPLDSDDEATPIRVSTTPGPPECRVYQDLGGKRQ